MRLALIPSFAVAAAVGLSACGSSASSNPPRMHLPAAFSGMTASEIANRSLAAAGATTSLSYSYAASGLGKVAADQQIAGQTEGRQIIHQNGDVITVLLVKGVVYELCNASAMKHQFGAKTQRYAGQWIAFQSSNHLFHTLSSGVLLASVVKQLAPHHTNFHVQGTATVRGQRVVVLAATITNSNVKYVVNFDLSTTAPYLPVAALANGTVSGSPVKSSTYFSSWNAPVVLHAPATFIPSSLVIK